MYWESDRAHMESENEKDRYDGVRLTLYVCTRIQKETNKIKMQYMITDSIYGGVRWYMPEGK